MAHFELGDIVTHDADTRALILGIIVKKIIVDNKNYWSVYWFDTDGCAMHIGRYLNSLKLKK